MELTPRLPHPGSLFKNAWRAFKGNLRLLLPISILSAVASLLFSLVSYFAPEINPVLLPILFLVGIVLAITSQIALLVVIMEKAQTVSGAYKQGLSLFFPYIWITILTTLAILGGLAAFVIPMFIVIVFLSLTGFILVGEQLHGMNVLVKSAEYVTGYWFAVAGRILVMIILTGILFGVTSMFFAPETPGNALAQAVISVVLVPVLTLYIYNIYVGLKEIKSQALAHTTALGSKGLKGFIALGIVVAIAIPIVIGYLDSQGLIERRDRTTEEAVFDEDAFEEAIREALEKQGQLQSE